MKRKINLYGEDLRVIGFVKVDEDDNSISRSQYNRQRDKMSWWEQMFADIELKLFDDRYDNVYGYIPSVEKLKEEHNYSFHVENHLAQKETSE